MHWTDRRERYRAHISGNECLHPGSVFDAISARIAEELEHRDTALEHGAEQAPGYKLLSEAIKAGCRVAIKLSEKI